MKSGIRADETQTANSENGFAVPSEKREAKQAFAGRIHKIADLVGNASILAKKTGISRRTIGFYMTGEADPSREKLIILAEAAGVLLEWLASGRGPMRQGDPDYRRNAVAKLDVDAPCERHQLIHGGHGRGLVDAWPIYGKEIPSPDLAPPAPGFCRVPLCEIEASAGPGCLLEDEVVSLLVVFKVSWIRQVLRVSPDRLCMTYVRGESMDPTLRTGDVILVDRSEVTPTDGIFLLRLEGALLVKRLQRLPGGVVKVSSDNPSYHPFEISSAAPPDDLVILGRVVWSLCGRRL